MKSLQLTPEKCPCDSGKSYEHCCKNYLNQKQSAPTAEALMRSRYTAFTLLDEDYLRLSWHPDTCPKNIRLNENTIWLGLTIKKTTAGRADDGTGTVEFVARNKINGKAQRLHENSHFVKIDNHWLYVDGDSHSK